MSVRSECNLLSVGQGGEDKITEDKDEEIEKIFFLRLPQNLKNQVRHLSSWLELCLKPVTSQKFPPFTPCTIIERTHMLYMQDFNTCKGSI